MLIQHTLNRRPCMEAPMRVDAAKCLSDGSEILWSQYSIFVTKYLLLNTFLKLLFYTINKVLQDVIQRASKDPVGHSKWERGVFINWKNYYWSNISFCKSLLLSFYYGFLEIPVNYFILCIISNTALVKKTFFLSIYRIQYYENISNLSL